MALAEILKSTDLLLPPEKLHFTTEQRELEKLFWAYK